MKKLVFATMMCIAAMSANAQVLTSETVKHVYEEASLKPDSKFAFNADFTGQDITTMYVYRMNGGGRDMQTLKPHVKYDYTYAADGTLTSKVTYRWDDNMNSWKSTARYDYTLADGQYSIEYSRYNPTAKCFDQPVDKMVYSMTPYDNYVSSYHRNDSSLEYQLISELQVVDAPELLAEK